MRRFVLAALVAAPLLMGCFKTQYTYGPKPKGDANHEEWRHRVFWGVIELDDPVNVSEVCPGGDFSRIRTKSTLGNSLVNVLVRGVLGAGGIDWYSPSTIEVWCADGTAYRAQVEQDGTVLSLQAPEGQGAPTLQGE